MNWCQQLAFITLIFNTHFSDPQVQLALIKPDVLQCKINDEVRIFNLEGKISWPINVSVDVNGKVQLQLIKKKPELWKKYGKVTENSKYLVNPDFWPGKILRTVKVTHDSYLITLKYDNFVYNYINPGYHIVIKKTINDIEGRPYTPVPTLPLSKSIPPGDFQKTDEEISLLIKVYQEGFMSSWISSHPGATVFLSNPAGSFKTSFLNKINEIYFFAGGTGITPMIGVMNWALKTSSDKILKLFYFNKSKRDIIWNTELEELASSFSNRLLISHILSQPDLDWSGRTGHIDLELMKSVLPASSGDKPRTDFVCICGRPSFADDAERFLKQHLGYTMENYFNFNRNIP